LLCSAWWGEGRRCSQTCQGEGIRPELLHKKEIQLWGGLGARKQGGIGQWKEERYGCCLLVAGQERKAGQGLLGFAWWRGAAGYEGGCGGWM